MNSTSRIILAIAASALLGACTVSPAGSCSNDSQCTAPAACDPARHVCALPCEPKCGVGELCLSAKCVQQGPVVRSVSAPGTWSRRAGNLAVIATIDSGPGATTSAATLHVAGSADVPGTTSDAGAVRTYAFSVPASVQAAGSEAPVAFTIDAVDDAGHSTLPDAAGTGQLLIDDAPPQPSGVTVNGGVTGADGLQWFKQAAAAPIDVQVSIQDAGSGVNASTLELMSGASRLDNGAGQCTSSTSSALLCHFFVDPHHPLIPPGGQGEITFTVAGQDLAGNAMTVHQARLGIDGKAPVIQFAAGYPAAGTDCNAGGGDGDSIFCGHDGSHFFRAGDAAHSLSFSVVDASAAPGDVGSGANPATGTCAIAGTTCTATFNAGSATFTFPADFSAAAFASGPDGTGDVQVTLDATDLVGNVAATVPVPVHVTRLKWMRSMAGKVDTFKGSPIATTVPVPQVIFAGSERTDALGPIASFGPDGTVLWRTGHNDVGTISNNVAYSPTTKRLYVLGDNTTKMFAYAVGPAAIMNSYNCVLSANATQGNAVGSPAIMSGPTERVLVADTQGRLWSLSGVPGSGCDSSNTFTSNGGTWAALGTPTFDGSLVYVPHDGSKLSNVAFGGGTFGAIVDATPFSIGIFNSVAIAGSLFFGNRNAPAQLFSYSYSPSLPATFSQDWASTPVDALSDALISPVVVGPSFGFASPTTVDGQLHAFDKASGAQAWRWPTAATKIGNISAPTLGADGVIYFSSDNPKQLIPLKVSGTPGTPSLANGWAEFKGSSLQKTPSVSTPTDTTVDSLTTEPVIDSRGVIYFGTAAGKVFALITDSGGPLLPVAGQTWPRVGFDNCNSSNTAFACQ